MIALLTASAASAGAQVLYGNRVAGDVTSHATLNGAALATGVEARTQVGGVRLSDSVSGGDVASHTTLNGVALSAGVDTDVQVGGGQSTTPAPVALYASAPG